jgi:hypothetical protein
MFLTHATRTSSCYPARFARYAIALLLALLVSLLPPRTAFSVAGGKPVSIRIAPWTALIKIRYSTGEIDNCTGTILDQSHVVTAGHCLYDSQGRTVKPVGVTVLAGISSVSSPRGTDAEQRRTVAFYTVHPYFECCRDLYPDDIAVLSLARPLTLGSATARAVALPHSDSRYPKGASTILAGFGTKSGLKSGTGTLRTMHATVDDQGRCGGLRAPHQNGFLFANAVIFCAFSSGGAACEGDSGAGLVTVGHHPRLIGIAVAGSRSCLPGAQTVFAYVGAPEILRFLDGDLNPPLSPLWSFKGGLRCVSASPLRVGMEMRCTNVGLMRAKHVTFAFFTGSGRLLHAGTVPIYVVQASAIGQRVHCIATAVGPGGTTLQESLASDIVKARDG